MATLLLKIEVLIYWLSIQDLKVWIQIFLVVLLPETLMLPQLPASQQLYIYQYTAL